MADVNYKLKASRTCRIKYGAIDRRIRPGETVTIDFTVQAQSDAVDASGRSVADFDTTGDAPHHIVFV